MRYQWKWSPASVRWLGLLFAPEARTGRVFVGKWFAVGGGSTIPRVSAEGGSASGGETRGFRESNDSAAG